MLVPHFHEGRRRSRLFRAGWLIWLARTACFTLRYVRASYSLRDNTHAMANKSVCKRLYQLTVSSQVLIRERYMCSGE